MDRRKYTIEPIYINEIQISEVIIDPHYEENHSDHMTDELVIELVKELDGRTELAAETDEEGFSYFVTLIEYSNKQYRLVWLLEEGAIYIGVVNAFRDDRRK